MKVQGKLVGLPNIGDCFKQSFSLTSPFKIIFVNPFQLFPFCKQITSKSYKHIIIVSKPGTVSRKIIVIGLITNDNMVERVCSIATLSDSPVHRGFIQLKESVIKLTFTIFKR